MLTFKPIAAKGIGPDSMICLYHQGLPLVLGRKSHILLSHSGEPGHLNSLELASQKEEIKSDLGQATVGYGTTTKCYLALTFYYSVNNPSGKLLAQLVLFKYLTDSIVCTQNVGNETKQSLSPGYGVWWGRQKQTGNFSAHRARVQTTTRARTPVGRFPKGRTSTHLEGSHR